MAPPYNHDASKQTLKEACADLEIDKEKEIAYNMEGEPYYLIEDFFEDYEIMSEETTEGKPYYLQKNFFKDYEREPSSCREYAQRFKNAKELEVYDSDHIGLAATCWEKESCGLVIINGSSPGEV